MGRGVNLEVKLPSHVRPSDEATEALIKKFLKECSKESLVQDLAEKSAWTRRFTKKSIKIREKKMRYKRNAQKHQQELNNESLDKTKKVKKNKTIGGKQPNKVEK
jgi:ribosomal protein S21